MKVVEKRRLRWTKGKRSDELFRKRLKEFNNTVVVVELAIDSTWQR